MHTSEPPLPIEPIGQSESDEFRNAFIQAFVRKVPNIYHEHIEKVTYRDGLPYYKGFLWEFLYDRGKTDTVPISEEDGLRRLETHDTVLFMFDLFFTMSATVSVRRCLPLTVLIGNTLSIKRKRAACRS